MKRRCIHYSLVILEMLLLCAGQGWCEPVALPEVEEVAAELSAGYHLYNPKGYRGRVGEYEVLDTGMEAQFLLEGRSAGTRLSLTGETLDQDDQTYGLSLDVRRILRSDVAYKRFRHFLDHDPLTNQDSARDADRLRNNILTVEEFRADNALLIPGLPFLKFTADIRSYSKHGTRQALTVGKCSKCHVSSRNRRVDTSTNDVTAGLTATLGPATLTYASLLRDFSEHGSAPRNNYGNGASFFLVRGMAPYNRVPDSRMNLHTLTLSSRLPLAASLFLTVQHGERENKLTRRETGINTVAARLSKYLSRFLACDVFYARHSTDNKNHGGIDHDRERGGIDINAHPLKHAGLVCSYFWETVERDNAAANSTRRETYRISYNQRLLRTLRLNLKYQRTRIDDPFITRDQTFSTLVQTALPSRENEAFASLGWTLRHNFTLHANLRCTNSRNSRFAVDEDRREFVLSFWYAPVEALTLSGAYTRADNEVNGQGSLKTYHLRGAESLLRYDDIPYDSSSQSWTLSAALRLTRKVSLTADITGSDSVADFDKNLSGRNFGSFSDLSIGQVETSLGMAYALSRRLSLNARYLYREYNDHKQSCFDGQVNMVSCGIAWAY
jgi:hypothetical protein